jgi:hypothetical protein
MVSNLPVASLVLIVAAESVDFERRSASFAATPSAALVFGQSEDHGNRLQLRQNQHGIRIRRMNDVARIDLPQADAPAERRRNVAVDDVQFRGLDLRLIRAHGSIQLVHERLLRVDLLLRNAARGNQRRVTVVDSVSGVAQLRLVAKQLRLHLIQLPPGRGEGQSRSGDLPL